MPAPAPAIRCRCLVVPPLTASASLPACLPPFPCVCPRPPPHSCAATEKHAADNRNQPTAIKMRETLALVQKKAPWLEIDGEMHGDVALDGASRAAQMPTSTLIGNANLLVLPNLDAANIAYNLLKTAAGGNIAIGPVLLGAAKPVHILTASTTVRRIVNMTALTVADASAAR